MSDTNKLAIVILVAIVVLFFLFVGVGASGGIKSINVNGVVNSFAGLLPSPAVDLNDITASPESCLNRSQRRLLVTISGCELTIAASDATVRSLKLQIAPGRSVNITTTVEPVEDQPLDIDADLPNHNEDNLTLTFFKSETPSTVIISACSDAGGCALNILE
ncbi:MAG: hypothetical protein IT319_07130 [Anaerolineae bacterium]|nr:hypothetical protein [Anaerolineae bacterium]